MKKMMFVLVLLVSSLAVNAQTNTKVVTNLSAERFKAASANDKNSMIIDLRTIDEITTKGFIKGAMQIDYLAKDAEQKIDKLDKNKTYYIYCAGGGRSGECAEYMEKHGFKRVYNLEKGFSEWVTKGFPIEK
ncbi:MAG: Rhodanese-like protein [Bacteroidetes bacterium]|jgi:phage shock protein E|nr:Rhodanese-like protein [Bacteroidota bacterium]